MKDAKGLDRGVDWDSSQSGRERGRRVGTNEEGLGFGEVDVLAGGISVGGEGGKEGSQSV